jgi:hypothetical protein
MAIAVSEAAATAIAVAVQQQTAFMQVAFGSTAGVTPGTIAWTINSLNKQAEITNQELQAIATQLRTVNTAIGTLATELEKNRTGLANIQFTMSRQVATQQIAVANEIRVAKFQEQTVNTALKEAGKPPIEVTPTNFVDGVKTSVEDISVLNAQTTIAATITNVVSNAITEGIQISTTWAAQTAVGAFVTSYVTELKLKTQLLFADDEAKAGIRLSLSRLYALRNGE